MSFNCVNCESYNKGKGTKACFACENIKSSLPPKTRFVPVYKVEDVTELQEYYSQDLTAALQQLDPAQSTMILQSHFLKMSHREIGEYHKLDASTCNRRIKKGLSIIKGIMGKG